VSFQDAQASIVSSSTAILLDSDFPYVCMTYAEYVLKHLKQLELQVRRPILVMLSSKSEASVPLTRSNVVEMGPQIVLHVLDEVVESHWMMQYGWLQLQLVLDEWATVTNMNSALEDMVKLFLGHFASHWSHHSIYGRLAGLLGPTMQTQVVKAGLSVLERQYSPQSLSTSNLDLGRLLYVTDPAPMTDGPEGEDELCHAFANLLITCLTDSAASRKEYVMNIGKQLQHLVNNTPQMDALDLPIGAERALQRSIWLRLKLLASLYPATRNSETVSVLVMLMARPIVFAGEEDGGERGGLLSNILFIISSLVEEDDGLARSLISKMLEAYRPLLANISFSQRSTIESSLPFLSVGPPIATPQPTPTLDPWTLLEDYPDGPLSPSQLGASRVDRKEPSYVAQAFERAAEPPIKRIKIS